MTIRSITGMVEIMETLESLISDVVDIRLMRPDLLDFARKQARAVLFNIHALSNFHRDRTRTPTTLVNGNTTAISLPADFRFISGILAYAQDGTRINQVYAPCKLELNDNYFNIRGASANYYLIGGAVTCLHYMPAPYAVALEYYRLPTFIENMDGTVETDSWLLEAGAQGYELVAAKLTQRVASVINNKDMVAAQQLVIQQETINLLAREQ